MAVRSSDTAPVPASRRRATVRTIMEDLPISAPSIHDEVGAGRPADFEYGDDVRVVQGGNGPGFLLKPRTSSSSAVDSPGRSLIATSRCSRVSRAGILPPDRRRRGATGSCNRGFCAVPGFQASPSRSPPGQPLRLSRDIWTKTPDPRRAAVISISDNGSNGPQSMGWRATRWFSGSICG